MKIYKITILLLLMFIVNSHAANMILDKKNLHLKIFYTQSDCVGWDAVLKGKILSFSTKEGLDKKDIVRRLESKSKVTVRLYNNDGIKEGDTLFVINGKNLIVSRMKVNSIFKSKSFGYLLIGYGNFKLGSISDRVVQRVIDEYSKYAYINKCRGDYFFETGETSKAITEYKKAIELDRGNPEAHLALGNIYFKQGLFKFAFKEFSEAYKHLNRLYDNEDKYFVLKGLCDIRFREVYYSYLPKKVRNKFRDEGIRYSKEALQIYPDSVDMNYYLGVFYYKNPSPSDKVARDYFLKVIDLYPEHVDANVALSELYFKHRNKVKAKRFAEIALKADPANQRARELLKYIEKYNR